MNRNSLFCFLVRETRPTDQIGENVRAVDSEIRAEIINHQTSGIIDTSIAERLLQIWDGYKFAVGVNGRPWNDHYNFAARVGECLN